MSTGTVQVREFEGTALTSVVDPNVESGKPEEVEDTYFEFAAGTVEVLKRRFEFCSKHRKEGTFEQFVVRMAEQGSKAEERSVETSEKTRQNRSYMADKAKIVAIRGMIGDEKYFQMLDKLDVEYGVGGTPVELPSKR